MFIFVFFESCLFIFLRLLLLAFEIQDLIFYSPLKDFFFFSYIFSEQFATNTNNNKTRKTKIKGKVSIQIDSHRWGACFPRNAAGELCPFARFCKRRHCFQFLCKLSVERSCPLEKTVSDEMTQKYQTAGASSLLQTGPECP